MKNNTNTPQASPGERRDWIARLHLPSRDKLTLLALEYFCPPDSNQVTVSQKKLVAFSGHSRRTILNSLSALEDTHRIIRVRRTAPGWGPSAYTLLTGVQLDAPPEQPRRNRRTQVSPTMRLAVYKRDQYRCRYCGRYTAEITLDHVRAISLGGENRLDNLVTCCHRCNSRKQDRTPEEAGMTLLPTPS